MTRISLAARSAMALGLALCAALAPAIAGQPMHVSGEPAPAFTKDLASLQLRSTAATDAVITRLRLPPIAADRLNEVRIFNSQPGLKALQIGIDRSYGNESTLDPQPALKWMKTGEGGRTARFSVGSPGAAALRLGIGALELPSGAELRFAGAGQSSSVVEPVTRKQLSNQLADGIYWTPVTEGESQLVEIYLPDDAAPAQVSFSIASVAHLLASPYGDLKGLKIGESDSCEIDANCINNPTTAYNNAKNAVARMTYQKNGSSFLCSGTLLNDTVSSSFIPYFYSANHCIDNQSVASTLSTFWFEESTSCGSGIASSRVQVGGGATLLYNNAATDALLLRLNNNAPSGSWFTGWNTAAVTAGTSVVVLHHPAGDVKKVSLGQITGFGPYNGAGDFIRAGYTNGTTEGGSSGSGILTLTNGEYVLRGGLYGGSASCANTGNVSNVANSDAYSRFDVVYPNLQQYLSPGAPPPSQQLQNGVAVTGLSGAQGANLAYTIVIPSGSTNLVVSTSGGTGDPDLYVRFGSAPTTTTYDCRSFADGPTEQCTFASPQAGTYHVLINGFSAFSGTSLTASWQAPVTNTQLQNGVAVNGLSGATGASLAYTIAIPSGASNLVVRTSGGSGDPDLYVRLGSAPTTGTYDCRSIAVGPTEQCTFATPSAGTYHVLISGFAAFSGLSLTATWTVGGGGGVDEPSYTNFQLPVPNPPFPNCPGGYFVVRVEDGLGAGLSPGIFGMELLLNPPGTQRLEGGLNFGGLLDGSQVAFAGFNFQNPANEEQRVDLILNGNPASSRSASLPVRIRVIRQPAPGVDEVVLDTTATLSQATQFVRSINLTPSYYVVTVGPTGAASVPGGAADGEVYVSLATQFVNRPGGGFFGGVVVGGYHATHPFGGVSGFASFCIATQHFSNARLFAAPSYGATGARDLRLRVLDNLGREVLVVPN